MDRNGNPIEWLGIKREPNPNQLLFVSGISVSPDQHYISFWFAPDTKKETFDWSLVVIDLISNSAKDLCILQKSKEMNLDSPLWSPDGTQLLVNSFLQEDQKDMVLVDVKTEKAYLVTRNASPVDWMIDR